MKRDNPETILGPVHGHEFRAGWSNAFLEVQLISDLGKTRQNNEDACMLHVPESGELLEARGVLMAVADGMGGASAGEYASHKTLEYIVDSYFDTPTDALIPAALQAAVQTANELVFEESERNPELAGMGTTISALAIVGDWAYIAQVGDSRIYLLRRNQSLKQLTHDHSLVAEQMRNGLINEEEARTHSLKNLITRAVGIKETVEVDLFAVQLQQDDSLLLCSDGLSNMLGDDVIGAYLQANNLQQLTEALVEEALEAGGNDNISIVAVRVTATPPPTGLQQGARLVSFDPPRLVNRLCHFFSRR